MATWTLDKQGSHWLDRRDIGMQLEAFAHRKAWLVACYTTIGGRIWSTRFETLEAAKAAAEEHAHGWTPRAA